MDETLDTKGRKATRFQRIRYVWVGVSAVSV
jgi:hypothetical protein